MRAYISILLCITALQNVVAQSIDGGITKMLPDIPAGITEPQKRADYLAMHFWDKFDFSNIMLFEDGNIVEQYFADYIDVISMSDSVVRINSLCAMMQKAEKKKEVFNSVMRLCEKYLYSPQSPVYDEEKFIPVLEYAIQSQVLDSSEKIRPEFLLRNVMQNRIGRPANDFVYTLVNGATGTLYDVKADYTLLYFNDPDCDDCAALTRKLIASPDINGWIESGRLRIVAMYLNDDIEAWKNKAASVLSAWIYARDAEQKILAASIYDVRHTPTLYLLDRDKKVALKDVSFDRILEYLNSKKQ